jgi:hypothetical protein
MRVFLAAVTLLMPLLAGGCTGSGSPNPSLVPSEGPVWPGAGGDVAHMSPTFIAPTCANLHGKITVLARTTPTQPTIVYAKVTSLSREESAIKTLVRSRIVLVSQVFETVKRAHGAGPPIPPDRLLESSNVIASSPVVRTTDLKDHLLTLHVPTGLTSRDYFIVGIQVFTELCTPRSTGNTESVVGLVRVATST